LKSETTIMLTIALALAIALVGGLIVVPVIEEAEAHHKTYHERQRNSAMVAVAPVTNPR
jgi:Na+-transporting NADH:ubiquinone oxidoreductase subunit NqrC